MRKAISHMKRPAAVQQIPRYASFNISEADGLKKAAPISAYSKTASTNHIRDAPQNIKQGMRSLYLLLFELKYHIKVLIIAANSVITRHISLSPH